MDHLQECIKVSGINIIAVALSLTQIETFLRMGGLILAVIYSCLKIWQLLKEIKSK